METLRERRCREGKAALARAETQRDSAISRLVRVNNKIKTLARSVARYEKAIAEDKEKERARKAKLKHKATTPRPLIMD